MRHRAESSGVYLTASDAAQVKGMAARGDRQHDIASWFGVNPGRIAEVIAGDRFRDVEAVPRASLPPPGPYPKPQEALAAIRALAEHVKV